MSNLWMNRAYATPLRRTHKSVLVALADYADDEGVCFPSNATLALKCGVTDRTIRRVKASLIELGYLRLVQRTGRSCLYQLCIPEGAVSDDLGADNVSLEVAEGRTECPVRADFVSSKRTDCPIRADAVSSITIIEPSVLTLNEPSTPPSPSSGAVCDVAAVYAVDITGLEDVSGCLPVGVQGVSPVGAPEQLAVGLPLPAGLDVGLPSGLPVGVPLPSSLPVRLPVSAKQAGGDRADDVQTVFDYWKQVMSHPRAALDKKRRRVIAEALKLYSVDDLKKAVDGCRASPFHMGDNDRNRRFDNVDLIFRNADKIDDFIGFYEHPPVNRVRVMTAADQSMAWAQAMDRLTGNSGNSGIADASDEDGVIDVTGDVMADVMDMELLC